MTRDELKELLNREPFEPFRLLLRNEDSQEILDSHCVALGSTRFFITFPHSDKSLFLLYEHIEGVESASDSYTRRRCTRPLSMSLQKCGCCFRNWTRLLWWPERARVSHEEGAGEIAVPEFVFLRWSLITLIGMILLATFALIPLWLINLFIQP